MVDGRFARGVMAPPGPPRLSPGEVYLLALLALFPLGPRFGGAVGNIYLATILTLVWLAAWTLFVFAGPGRGLSLATSPQRALLAYAGFLLVQMLLHLGMLFERPASVLRAVQFLAHMGLFVTVASLRLDEHALRRFVRLSFVVLVVECALAWRPDAALSAGFLVGTFDYQHNSLGAYLVLMLCLLFGFLSFSTARSSRILFGVLIAVSIASLACSFSRTAYLAAPAGVLALVHLRWGRRAFVRSLLGLGALILLSAALAPAGVRDRFGSILEVASGEGSDESFATRLALWRHGVEALARTGFLGVGVFGFNVIDNYFVRALAETGPIGLGLLVWLIVAILSWLRGAYRRESAPQIRALALGLYGSTVGLLIVMNLGGDMFVLHRVMGIYWVLLGGLVSVHLTSSRRSSVGGDATERSP